MTDEERQDLMARVAWLYHVEDLTQAEVADRLGMTRRAVNEMLAEARARGLVRVEIGVPLAECLQLESALRDRFGLAEAAVVPVPVDPALLRPVLGRAAAEYLGRMLPRWQPRRIGVGWGNTLRHTIQQLAPQKCPDLVVKSMIGGLASGTEINTFETARGLAEKLGAQTRYFTAPVYADSPASRDSILSQPVFRALRDESTLVDLALLSVGDAGEDSRLVRYALPPGQGEDLRRAGAVGDLICRFLDADGRELDHPVNRQGLGPELDALRQVPLRVIVSGGPAKAAVMRAVARAGLATTIITDTATARFMLREDG